MITRVLLCVVSVYLWSVQGCNDGKIRGVNAGGWLLLEPWITPNFFEDLDASDGNQQRIVDEYTLAQYVDPAMYRETMKNHWATFISLADFQRVAQAGVSHIRVPVGYWYWDVESGEPFQPPNQDHSDSYSPLFYLKQAFLWAAQTGIKIEVDVHAGPESQNPFDNSGRRRDDYTDIHWCCDGSGSRNNIERSLATLDKISSMLKSWLDTGVISWDSLYGICVLNEPFAIPGDRDDIWIALRDDYYPKAYETIRQHLDDRVFVNYQGAFRARWEFDDYYNDFSSVSIDRHIYQCFGWDWCGVSTLPELEMHQVHYDVSCGYCDDIQNANKPTFTGEFSLAITECQKYLVDGYKVPYHPPHCEFEDICSYYNAGWDTFPQERKDFYAKYFLAQTDCFEFGDNGAGWFFWTMKTEEHCAPEWDFIFLLDNGIIPGDLCNKGHVCY